MCDSCNAGKKERNKSEREFENDSHVRIKWELETESSADRKCCMHDAWLVASLHLNT